ncbi:MAG: CopG family transcriptional regulator [Lentisphaeria bacterium]|nr:CopG family transcriptional regulator [Lentisphaeria bacterium]
MKQFYNAVLSGGDGEYISVSFPDFPGCVTGGDDIAKALVAAREALEFHLAGMAEDGEAIPDQSDPAALKELLAEANGDLCRIAVIEAEVPDGERERINITVPRYVLQRIDRFSGNHNRTRSAFLSEAAMEYIRNHG